MPVQVSGPDGVGFLNLQVRSVVAPFLVLPIDATFKGNAPCPEKNCTIHNVAISAIVDHSLNRNKYVCDKKGPNTSWGCDDKVLTLHLAMPT